MEVLKRKTFCLLTENAELRKMVGLMQENVELQDTFKKHENHARTLSFEGKHDGPMDDDETEDSRDHQQSPSCNDAKDIQHWQKIVGEIAFQLERRILTGIFQQKNRQYGFLVSNIEEKIIQVTTCPFTSKVDEKLRAELTQRYHETMSRLKKIGYDKHAHPVLSEYLVNMYGLMDADTKELACSSNRESILRMVRECTPKNIADDVEIIFNCLYFMSIEDGEPLFM
ncbi:speriolin-like [Pseudophryne corroboree]|uniref:speriolin-like n=1 Tax=Pseudophryne corroboree TaxID=495146 RepID=UPI003081E4D5